MQSLIRFNIFLSLTYLFFSGKQYTRLVITSFVNYKIISKSCEKKGHDGHLSSSYLYGQTYLCTKILLVTSQQGTTAS